MKNTNEKIHNLAKAFLSLSGEDECLAFFDDLFTAKELAELSARLEVARLLKAGANYIDIANKTGASTATISRVSKALSGERGGYRAVLQGIAGAEGGAENTVDLSSLTEREASAIRALVASLKKQG